MDPHEFEVILMYILNSKTKEKEVTAFVTVEWMLLASSVCKPQVTLNQLNHAAADRRSAYDEEQTKTSVVIDKHGTE